MILLSVLSGCQSTSSSSEKQIPTVAATLSLPGLTPSPQETHIPVFSHVVVILLENHGYSQVIGNDQMPNFNALAKQNVLLTNYHAVTHPSLPNYIALIGGGTFGITTDCNRCFVNEPSLPDLIEASGRTWKTYQEDLPSPCYTGSSGGYAERHDPFIYFDPIRNDAARCKRSVVDMKQLDADILTGKLPDFSFIMPNLCNSGHSCDLQTADKWLDPVIKKLQLTLALDKNSLIFITFDESGNESSSCCGLGESAGGHVAAVLISPLVKAGFQDDTPLSHYSFLKTILLSWKLPALGFTSNPATQAITAPWK